MPGKYGAASTVGRVDPQPISIRVPAPVEHPRELAGAQERVRSAGMLENDARTAGLLLSGERPESWQRFVDLTTGDARLGGEVIAGLLRSDDERFSVDLASKFLRVQDDQAAPVARVELGKLGTGDADYGLRIRSAAGTVLWDLSGLGIGTVGEAHLQLGAVTTTRLGDAAVTAEKLHDRAVTTAKIGDSAVTVTKLADGAVTEAKIGDASVTTAKLGDRAVTTLKLGDLAVDASKLADSAVTTAKLADFAVDAAKLLDGAVSLPKFAAGLRPFEIVDELPAPGVPGRIVALSAEGFKLYRDTGTTWTAEVPARDISGQLTTDQIIDFAITAQKLTLATHMIY